MSARAKLLRWLAVLLVVLATAHTGLWWFAIGQLASGLDAWVAEARAAGWTVSFPAPTRGGWPLTARLAFPEMTVAAAVLWQAHDVELSLTPAEPRLLRMRVGGAQVLSAPGLPPIGVTAATFAVTIPLDDPAVADLAAERVRAELPAGVLEIGTLAAHAVNRPGAGPGQQAATLVGSAQAIALPPPPDGRAWAFGPRLASVSVDAALSGPVPPPGSAAVRATRWRDGGGVVQLRRLALGWGPLGLDASASLRLDGRLQPAGSGRIRLVGYEAALDALVASGAMAPRQAMVAKGLMALVARPPEGGGAAQVELPLTLDGGTLVAGKFPLLRVPDFVWP
jgi:hypothetical protein